MELITPEQQPLEGEYGEWLTADKHHTDERLAYAMAAFLSAQKHNRFGDLGCGHGGYVKILREAGLDGFGVDGCPMTAQLTDGMCACMNIAVPQPSLRMDWSICLEVGEHIPAQYEDVVLDNICLAKYGAIVSWAHPGQGGRGHVNCRSKDWLYRQMDKRGFYGWNGTGMPGYVLARAAYTHWLQENILVFGNAKTLIQEK